MMSLEYLAGFFDGEGCVNLTVRGKSRQVCLRLMIVNTDATILQEIQNSFGGLLCKPRVSKSGWKAFRQIQFNGQAAYDLLLKLVPHLRVKRRQAELAIEFFEFQQLPWEARCEVYENPNCPIGFSQRRKQETVDTELNFKERMHELNKKGLVG